MKKVILFLCCSLWSVCGFADAFDASRVPSNAKWVLHFDMVKFKASEFGAEIIAKAEQDQNIKNLNDFLKLFGIDPVNNLNDITLYGTNYEKHDGVLVYHGSMNVLNMLDLVKKNGTVKSEEIKGFELFMISYNGHECYFFTVNNLIVLSKKRDHVVRHIEMLTGSVASLNDSNTNEVLMNSGDMIAVGTGKNMPVKVDDQAISESLKVVDQASAGIKEEGGLVKSKAVLTGTTEEAAESLEQFIVGMVGMGKLQTGEKPIINTFLKTVQVARSGKSITITGEVAVADLIQIIEKKGK